MLSRFLPPAWPDEAPLALLAGQGGEGSYPYELAERAHSKGAQLGLISLKGETFPELERLFDKNAIWRVTLGDVGGLLKALKETGAKGLIMAGSVTKGRLFKDVYPDWRALAIMARLKERNAETIFGALADEIEKNGVRVLDARSFMDEALLEAGWLCKGREKVNQPSLEHAIKIAEGVAALDIGQAALTRNGTTLLVEGYDGTDAMLERAAAFKTDAKIFIKTIKARQDFRFDVPIFGLRTVEKLLQAGVSTIILKAQSVIIPQKELVLKELTQRGLALLAY